MSHAMNMMLLKRSRGRPRKEGFDGGGYDDLHHHQPHHSSSHGGRVGSEGGAGVGGIPMSASTPSLATDPSASAFEMNWTSAYDDGGNRLTDTNTPFDERYGNNNTVGGGNFPGYSGLFGRTKRGRGQYSTDDEEFEEVTMSDNEGVSVTLDQSNAAQSSSSMLPPQDGEGDSQQAAEAMVQLSGTTQQQQQYFTQTAEESMEIDPNYDPSDFLGMSNRQLDSVDGVGAGGQGAAVDDVVQFQYQSQQDANFQQFGEQVSQFGEPQQIVIGEQQQQQPQDQQLQGQQQQQSASSSSGLPPLQSLHKDLAISDSDDEQNNLQMDIFNNGNENENDDDGGDLWF